MASGDLTAQVDIDDGADDAAGDGETFTTIASHQERRVRDLMDELSALTEEVRRISAALLMRLDGHCDRGGVV